MTESMGLRAQAVIVAVGFACTVATAWLLDLPRADTIGLLGLALGGAVVAAVIGAVVLRSMRTATLRAQGVAVALVSVFGTGVGVGLRWRYQGAMDDVTAVTTPTNPSRGVPAYMLVEEPFEVLGVLARCRAALQK